jgi:chromosome segregation ATPase
MSTPVPVPPPGSGSSNPRLYNSIAQRHSQSARAPARPDEPPESLFLDNIESYLERELSTAHSDSDRVHIYQSAFDLLTREFQLCRPLLERIKQQYDEMGKSLLAKKRVIMTDNSSVSAAEDTFSENVNRLRRAKAQEFSQRREETERLLDEMTDLRVQRSELQRQLDQLVAQKAELKTIDQDHAEKMTQVSNRLHELMDDIKQMETDSAQTKHDIQALQEKIEKTMVSADDLALSDQQLGRSLEELHARESELNDELKKAMDEDALADFQLEELHREIRALTRENSEAMEKVRSITERKQTTEAKIRELLLPYESAPNLPLVELVRKLIKRKRR